MDIAIYKGEDILAIGTRSECAEQLGIKKDTITFYGTPTYKNRVATRKNARNYITVVKLEDDE